MAENRAIVTVDPKTSKEDRVQRITRILNMVEQMLKDCTECSAQFVPAKYGTYNEHNATRLTLVVIKTDVPIPTISADVEADEVEETPTEEDDTANQT